MKKGNKKTAVITGATGGVGVEITARLLESGIDVYMLGRNFEKVPAEISMIEQKRDGQVQFCKADFDSETELLEIIERIRKVNKIDYLIHCAAFYSHGSLKDADVSNLDRSYRVNVRAPYLITRELLPNIIEVKGVVVFLNSNVVNSRGKKNLSHYAATKAALKAMADSVRKEVNRDGVRVLTVYLGKTATDMQKKACELEEISWKPEKMIRPEDAAKTIMEAADSHGSLEITDLNIRPSVSYK